LKQENERGEKTHQENEFFNSKLNILQKEFDRRRPD
jgi:hypothetical protein